MDTKKKDWKSIILISWAALSFVYIAWGFYQDFRFTVMQNAYVAGQTDTVNKLLEQASNKECKPFNVYSGEKKADLINVSCLQQTAPATEKTPAAPVTEGTGTSK